MALDRYLETWNSRDPRIWATSLQFPHVRPGAGPFKLTHNADEYVAGIDFEQTASTGWDHTEWVSREVLQVGVDKVHAAATWQRYTQGRTSAGHERHHLRDHQPAGPVGRAGPVRGGRRWSRGGRLGPECRLGAGRTRRVRRRRGIHTTFRRSRAPSTIHTCASPTVRSRCGMSADAFIAGTEAGRQRTWYRLRVDQVRPVQVTTNGVNLVISFSRLARDGSVMSKDEGLFLVTRRDGAWKIQARSTFGT